jgi:OOP family OmpA-OmpF porin
MIHFRNFISTPRILRPMFRIGSTLLLILACASLFGQSEEPRNIVPNPGFETFGDSPVGWYFKGEDFTRLVKYWSSPTGASPDAYGPKVRVPSNWADKGFGEQKPHGGNAMAGITVFGCQDGKPHCREYLQAQLLEPLVVGQAYVVECWVAQLPGSTAIDNIGFHFAMEKHEETEDKLLKLQPHFKTKDIVEVAPGYWKRLSGSFSAGSEAEVLIIGNFFPDEETSIRRIRDESVKYAYYYIDDVVVRKVPPFIPVPIKETDIRRQALEAGKSFQLPNLLFDFDKWELHPRSYIELDKVIGVMKDNPKMVIQINGHTDHIGEDQYNMYLSRKRAKSVVAYLNENGISRSRTLYKGYGESQPVAGNDSEEGRQLNRRVELLVVKM